MEAGGPVGVVAIIEVTNEGDPNQEKCLYVEERWIPEI